MQKIAAYIITKRDHLFETINNLNDIFRYDLVLILTDTNMLGHQQKMRKEIIEHRNKVVNV